MDSLKQKSVLLCVSGSIAAYKAAELARLLVRDGAKVRVAMTPAATRFVGPMTFEALTGNPVYLDVFASARGPVDRYGPESGNGEGIRHIEISKQPDLILIAPATADVIGRIASGYGDDIVTTSVLAASAPVVLAPAMNQRMWANPIVQGNVKRLRTAGYQVLGVGTGDLACGETGPGRMLEPAQILQALDRMMAGGPRLDLEGRRILVTLGRTEETVDPVRVLTNRSSGKMGVAIVEAAREAGAQVTVVAGPISIPLPSGIEVHNIRTADQMKTAVEAEFDRCDALVMCAAVGDYRAATEKLHKMESGQKRASIDLEPTEDILMSIKARRKKQAMIGFALETQAEEQRGRQKLTEKGLDLVIVQNPLKEGSEIGGDTNLCTFLHRSGTTQRLPLWPKTRIGFEIVRQVEYLLKNPGGANPPRVSEGAMPSMPRAADRPDRVDRVDRDEVQPVPGQPRPGGRPRARGGRRRSGRKKPPVESPS